MAFPVVESTATTGRAAETTSPVTFPATISAGALIIAIARCAVAGAIGWPVNWVELTEDSSDASDDVTAVAYFTAVGNEDGTTFNVTHGNGKSAYIVYSITGAAVPATQAPQISAVAVGTSTLPDPANLDPAGGAKEFLWLWLGGWEGEQTSPPVGTPTNYTNALGADTGVGGAIATNCRVASARRGLNATTENPPSWTISVSDDWTAWTMAVHPPPLVITPPVLALTIATFAPTVSTPRLVTPPTAVLTLAAFAPAVTVGVQVVPGVRALLLTPFAPTVLTPRLVTPPVLALTTTTFAPTVSTPRLVTPALLALTLTTFAPTVTVGASTVVTPGVLALLLTTFAPGVAVSGGVAGPQTGSLAMMGAGR